ncbi:MAG: hypothetical protein QG656_1351, partial [Candidatus Hydrogenedentes bacterium]|nr:hypothetical protein [Candidatus Hydrogenedentota bacterium]
GIETTGVPRTAITLLEMQAITEMIERNLTQLVVLLNVLTGLKSYEQ